MWTAALASILLALAPPADEGATTLTVDAGRVLHRVSPLLYGACIEDVNHEIYGGIYSQMIFGESFQEPPPPVPLRGYATLGGRWEVAGGEVHAAASDGPKLILEGPPVGDGEVSVDLRFPTAQGGNAGLIVRVDRPEVGADAWTGYEVSLETAGRLVLGRHRRNWEPIATAPCAVPVDRWINLAVRLEGATLEVLVDGTSLLKHEDREHPLGPGRVGVRGWQRPAHFRNFQVVSRGSTRRFPFEAAPAAGTDRGVSGMWRPVRRGDARGALAIEPDRPFVGRQAQRITREAGEGEVGVENRGLNRWGLHLVAGKPYEGVVWLRAERPTAVTVALEVGDGGRVLASTPIRAEGADWARYPFTLTPEAAAEGGRFAITLKEPGSVVVGYAALQPGEWGRFKGLPVRKDVAEGLVDQGVSILRYGGSAVNCPEYRWKAMIGPRDRRPPYRGTWYPHASNGWGIVDFLDLAEALGIPGIPAFWMGESPGDMADFVEYANGPADSPWGRRRAEDGHPAPYGLKHVELGNEEKVDAAYLARFRPMAEAIWAKDPNIILVVGDFSYHRVIVDPERIEGSDGANSLAAHRQILELARERGREIWFDIHTWTNRPPEPGPLLPERSFIDQLARLAPGANCKVAIFEYNANNHAMRRALSNALATVAAEGVGDRLPVACSANGLQPDGQNDNGWDQGLLFLNPGKVWLQPPGHLTRMSRRHHLPLLVRSELAGPAGLAANAKRSDDGRALVLQVVNPGDAPREVAIEVDHFAPTSPVAAVEQLAAPLDAVNTADSPDRVAPTRSEWRPGWAAGRAAYTFPPRSVTLIRLD